MSIEQIKNSANIKRNTITIKASDRTSGDNTNFTYDLGTTITDVRLVEIKSIELEHTAYNINTFTDRFNWTDQTGITHDLILDQTNYTLQNLLLQIQLGMNDQKTGTTQIFVTRFDGIDKVTFRTFSGGASFNLNFGITENSIASILGFSDVTLTGSASYTGDLTANINYSKNFFIGSTILMLNAFDTSEVSTGSTHVLFKLPTDFDYGELIFDEPNINIRTKIANLGTIDITIKDDKDRFATLTSGSDFTITLDIYSRIFNNSYSI